MRWWGEGGECREGGEGNYRVGEDHRLEVLSADSGSGGEVVGGEVCQGPTPAG